MDKKGKGRRSDRPPVDLTAQLKLQRDSFVSTFFKKGAEFTEKLMAESDHLRAALAEAERDNAVLRAHVASDHAIRELLGKIKVLEDEKEQLLSHVHEAEAHSTQFTSRQAQIEEELANLANLHVASFHLHSSLHLPRVVRALKELLTQLVGVRSYAIYMADDSRNELVVVSAEALAAEHLAAIPYGAGETQGDAQGMIEQAFVTGIARIDSGFVSGERSTPVACIPMRIDERAVGVIAIFSLLPQKEAFVPVDFELFRMLGPHAAAALVGAQLFSASAGIIPGVEVFQGMSPSLLPRPNVP